VRLTILNVAYPFAPVGPDAVGGAEQVLSAIDGALVDRGHRSIVVAAEGSRCQGSLASTPAFLPPSDEPGWSQAAETVRHRVEEVLRRERVDLVHVHGFGFERFLPRRGPPVLVTLHLPLAWYPAKALRPERPDVYFNCVSRAQRRTCPALAEVPVIPNGVAVERFLFRSRKRPFVLALGRICPEKGFHLAIEAAQRTGRRLLLAGQVFAYPAHEEYFRARILPRLDGTCRFLGPAGFARKRRLLAAARCLLVPSLAPETTSLVALEALASGTPVVAFRTGALPEIVESGRTGFLVDSVEEMAAGIEEVPALSSDECRRRAEERFPLEATVDGYLRLYRTMVQIRQ
jgi:glycosyltransferase involved in cell wall biosynthesis